MSVDRTFLLLRCACPDRYSRSIAVANLDEPPVGAFENHVGVVLAELAGDPFQSARVGSGIVGKRFDESVGSAVCPGASGFTTW